MISEALSSRPPRFLLILRDRHRATFGHTVAVVYTGGTVAHVMKLIFAFSWEYMPFAIDWALIVLGTYGGVGLVMYVRDVAWRGAWEKAVHVVLASHLLISVGVHIWTVVEGNHLFYTRFPYAYSYLGVAYFGFFAWRSWTMRLRPDAGAHAT